MSEQLVEQLSLAGVEVTLNTTKYGVTGSPECDLRLVRFWGVPYDPFVTRRAHFAPRPNGTAVLQPVIAINIRMVQLVQKVEWTIVPADQWPTYRQIQEWIDHDALIIPLLVPHHSVVKRQEAPRVDLAHDLYQLKFAEKK